MLQAMPATFEAFRSRLLSTDQVDLLIRTNQPNVNARFLLDEEMLVGIVSSLPYSGGVSALAHWTMQADPDGADDKSKKISKIVLPISLNCGWSIRPSRHLDPISGAIISSELQRLYDELLEADWDEAKALHGEDTSAMHLKRSPQQRRADAFVEMAKRSSTVTQGTQTPRSC